MIEAARNHRRAVVIGGAKRADQLLLGIIAEDERYGMSLLLGNCG
jgi:hypothetical protein